MAMDRSSADTTGTTLRALFDSVGAYVYAKDRQGRYIYANKAVCDLYDQPQQDILGRDDSAFMDMTYSESLVRNDREVLEHGAEIHEEEQMLLLHESKPRVFWTIKVPIRGEDNQIIGLSGISSELNDSFLNTTNSIRHNRLLNTILSNVDAYIYVKDFDGTYLSCQSTRSLVIRSAERGYRRSD